MPETTCWADEVELQRAARMYARSIIGRLPGTPEQEQAYRELCRYTARRLELGKEDE